jgi:hypothetical protein
MFGDSPSPKMTMSANAVSARQRVYHVHKIFFGEYNSAKVNPARDAINVCSGQTE